MREIKFRAWDNGRFEYWGLIDRNYYTCSEVYDHGNEDGVIIEEFTGLKDKNGKDVYEGDIVIYPTGRLIPDKGVVEWGGHWNYCGFGITSLTHKNFKGDAMGWELLNKQWEKLGHLEVIGNIHQHKELLKEK